MLFTGATSSVRGGGWLAFSSAKFALRGLVQSLARELLAEGPPCRARCGRWLIGDAGAETGTKRAALDPEKMADALLAPGATGSFRLDIGTRPASQR